MKEAVAVGMFPQEVHLKYKTKLCPHYEQHSLATGNQLRFCPFRDNCRDAHGVAELRSEADNRAYNEQVRNYAQQTIEAATYATAMLGFQHYDPSAYAMMQYQQMASPTAAYPTAAAGTGQAVFPTAPQQPLFPTPSPSSSQAQLAAGGQPVVVDLSKEESSPSPGAREAKEEETAAAAGVDDAQDGEETDRTRAEEVQRGDNTAVAAIAAEEGKEEPEAPQEEVKPSKEVVQEDTTKEQEVSGQPLSSIPPAEHMSPHSPASDEAAEQDGGASGRNAVVQRKRKMRGFAEDRGADVDGERARARHDLWRGSGVRAAVEWKRQLVAFVQQQQGGTVSIAQAEKHCPAPDHRLPRLLPFLQQHDHTFSLTPTHVSLRPSPPDDQSLTPPPSFTQQQIVDLEFSIVLQAIVWADGRLSLKDLADQCPARLRSDESLLAFLRRSEFHGNVWAVDEDEGESVVVLTKEWHRQARKYFKQQQQQQQQGGGEGVDEGKEWDGEAAARIHQKCRLFKGDVEDYVTHSLRFFRDHGAHDGTVTAAAIRQAEADGLRHPQSAIPPFPHLILSLPFIYKYPCAGRDDTVGLHDRFMPEPQHEFMGDAAESEASEPPRKAIKTTDHEEEDLMTPAAAGAAQQPSQAAEGAEEGAGEGEKASGDAHSHGAQLAQLQQQLQEVTQQLAAKDDEIASKDAALQEAQGRVAELKKKCQRGEETLSNAHLYAKGLQQRITELQNELEDKENELSEVAKAKAATKSKATQTEREKPRHPSPPPTSHAPEPVPYSAAGASTHSHTDSPSRPPLNPFNGPTSARQQPRNPFDDAGSRGVKRERERDRLHMDRERERDRDRDRDRDRHHTAPAVNGVDSSRHHGHGHGGGRDRERERERGARGWRG
ncbi:unnamed protein product [Vitrella brassicaformis CCMP3155]|uniref:C3H1-type domain-containing protein n=4 Tax=Vitrella brassicaformis TaxID=1169539 RepID=A0A0G4GEF8_VITBC|nr:unnamed protein product [Vitrella brassicaformis CCMP3155]|eukprot:CEM27521.1 unnamed protein product [Vitrella brassicaformis CCMP3155]